MVQGWRLDKVFDRFLGNRGVVVFYSEGLEFMVNLVAVPEEETEVVLTELKMPQFSDLLRSEDCRPLVIKMSVSKLLEAIDGLVKNVAPANDIVAFRVRELKKALKDTPVTLKPSQP